MLLLYSIFLGILDPFRIVSGIKAVIVVKMRKMSNAIYAQIAFLLIYQSNVRHESKWASAIGSLPLSGQNWEP